MRLLEQIVHETGAVAKSPHHLQIETPNGPHNVWVTKTGAIKLQMCSERAVQTLLGINELRRLVRNHQFSASELGAARLIQLVERAEVHGGVWVDAGCKGAVGRIAVVKRVDAKSMEVVIHRKNVPAQTSNEAEAQAIAWAKSLYPGEPIKCDNQSVAKREGVEWVPREQNKVADRFANVRG